ncbi:DUF1648 domain-containing protein [Streptomyces sp. NPDC001851]|uniref:DUF1648 domain-containing protein n=1 Tax=Streptomyces sp. NPDC001851 TaxID=3154529 RepID=UPI00331A06D4
MTDGDDLEGGRGRATRWGAAGCTAAVAALLAGLPWAAHDRLPDRLATHWSGGSATPDDSMPLWAVSLFPAGLWLLIALALSVRRRRSRPTARPWRAIALAPTATALVGAQASLVRANLDLPDWHEARDTPLDIVLVLAATAVAGVLAWRWSTRRGTAPVPAAPGLDLPEGERLAWFSRAANPWLQLLSALTGLIAAGALVALAVGLADPTTLWLVCGCCCVTALTGAAFSSVQAKVSEAGLEVSFGPLGWPARHWSPAAIESARAEYRLPSQVGGWGYRLSGLGTTVMLRAGDCLVVRPRGGRTDFAVSVDDAERGAALLNALRQRA